MAMILLALCLVAPLAYAAHAPKPKFATKPKLATKPKPRPTQPASPPTARAVDMAAPATQAADLPAATTPEAMALPNPGSSPAWIQWLGWSPDGKRLAWRQGPEWAEMLPGSPIEIARLDEHGAVAMHVHQRETPAAALRERHIRSPEPLFVERKTDRDVLLRTSTGRMLAVVVRRGATSVAAVLEKNRHSYDPIARWLIRGPADRVDVMAFEDLSHRMLALVVHTDAGPLRQAQLAIVPLSRKFPPQVAILTLPESATATSPRQP